MGNDPNPIPSKWGRLFPWGEGATAPEPNPCRVKLGHGPEGKTCKTCRWLLATSYRTNRTFYKCSFRGVTHGEGTDHRLKWGACGKYAEEEEEL